jgi:hypothetical protein
MNAVMTEKLVTIEREPFTHELFKEMLPLAQKCWNESTIAKGKTCAFYGERDFDVEPDLDLYMEMAKRGCMVVIALRVDGELQGYVEGFSYRATHHRKIIGGIGDNFYIEPPFRSYAAVLVEKFEAEMKKLGVGIIGWPVTPDGPVYELLKARGYVGDDIVMEKRICA